MPEPPVLKKAETQAPPPKVSDDERAWAEKRWRDLKRQVAEYEKRYGFGK